jgi:hypothetical protein
VSFLAKAAFTFSMICLFLTDMCAPQLCSWSAALLFLLLVERREAESTDTGDGVTPAPSAGLSVTRVVVAIEKAPEIDRVYDQG